MVEILRREYPGVPEDSKDWEDVLITWQEKLEWLEALHYYEDIYFWDIDFL